MDSKLKSDKEAKVAFAEHLVSNEFTEVKIVLAPSEIIAKKGWRTVVF